ncbi:o-succinylbenzoate synthase [Ferroplasma acidiphilum]|nr:o-succinylbenzoate synthase [Ferroplasma acidiphilum]MCL4349536.1 o-succinylbenzoate synthase [Candidatus Thermoplasmatota archaeon]
MKITYHKLKMPLISPFTTSFGTDINKDVYVFKLEHNGITAYSESVTDENPFYGSEDNYTVFHIVKQYLAPVVKGLPEPDEFNEQVKFIKGNNMAKASMEMLLYDYYAKANKKSLVDYIGHSRGYANVGISLGMDDINVTLKKIQEALDRGYKRIKVKIMKGKEIGILSAVRDNFPDIVLSADANSDYTEKDFDLIKKIDRYNLVYLEQPLYHDDIIYHSRLAKELSTPLCLDESITSPEKAQKAFEMDACRVINIKEGRLGGIGNSLKVMGIAKEFKGHVWIGGMLETGIGRSFNVSMASLSDINYPGDTSPNDKYFKNDIVKNPFTMENGTIKPNKGTGIGVEISEGYLKKYTVEEGIIA